MPHKEQEIFLHHMNYSTKILPMLFTCRACKEILVRSYNWSMQEAISHLVDNTIYIDMLTKVNNETQRHLDKNIPCDINNLWGLA